MTTQIQEFAIFAHANQLLEAMDSCRPSDALFPAEALACPRQAWAMPLSEFGGRQHFMPLAKQYGWRQAIAGRPPRSEFAPLWEVLAGIWSYRDSFQLSTAGHPGLPPDGEEPAGFDYSPDGRGMRYLLGARNEASSRRLLEILTDELTEDIRAAPDYVNGAASPSPFAYFWSIPMKRPSLTVLRAADRAWWGPVIGGPIEIYFQWPFSLEVATIRLHKFDWGIAEGVVLLSKDSPTAIMLRHTPVRPVFADIPQVVRLSVADDHLIAPLAVAPDLSNLKFTVQLSLVPQLPQRGLPHRIDELRREIRAKEELLRHLEDQTDLPGARDLALEPLLIYPDTGGVPFELQRLLVEWTDQRQDLQALYYQKLAPDALPKDLFRAPGGLHVLTTAAALGLGNQSDLGVRLREYQPMGGRFGSFDLLADWAEYQLRMFAPRGQWLHLYPALRPTEIAAQNLAQAVLPAPMQDWVALLLPEAEEGIRVLQLRRDSFRPLLASFNWDCALEIRINPLREVERIGEQTSGRIVEGIQREITTRVKALAAARIAEIESQLTDYLDLCAETIVATEQMASNHGKIIDQVAALMNDVIRQGPQRFASVAEIRAFAQAAGLRLRELDGLEQQQSQLQRALDKLRQQIQRRQGWLARK